MTILFYSLIVMTPLLFLLRRPRRELLAAVGLVALFLLINGRFAAGAQTVSWDTLFWSTEFQYIRELLQSGHLPGWNPFFNSGEPLYMYHQHYAMWQWFAFALIDKIIPANPVALFNLSFLFLFVFYNVGCYLFLTKLFKDGRVILYTFAVSLFSVGFVMHFQEFESLHFSIYFPYILYFLDEFAEQGRWDALALAFALLGVAVNAYVPHYLVLALLIFIASYLVFMERAYIKKPSFSSKTFVTVAGVILMAIAAAPVFYIFTRWSAFTSPMRTGLEDYMNPVQAVTGHHQEWKALFSFFDISGYTSMRGKLFIGIIPVTLAVVGAFRSVNRFRWAVMFAAVIIYFVSMGRNSFFYVIIHYVPTFANIRNYVEFEVFVQFFVVCLSGMGLEVILGLKEDEKMAALVQCLAVIGITTLAFAAVWFHEKFYGEEHLVTTSMYAVFIALSAAALALLIQTRSSKAFTFFFLALIFSLASFQWFFGYLNYQKIKASKAGDEVARLNELLSKNLEFVWKPTRVITYEQRLRVAEDYNTFEPALDGVERAFAEPVEKNLLITKRYYDLRDLRNDTFEYFGVGYPKIFLTNSLTAVPGEDVIAAMKAGYQDFLEKGTVFFAREDLPMTTEVDALGNIEARYALDITPMDRTGQSHAAARDNDGVYGYKAPDGVKTGAQAQTAHDENGMFGVKQDLADGDGEKLYGWKVLNSSSASLMDMNMTYSGSLVVALNTANTYFWDEVFSAPFVYKEVAGDFDVETHIEANHNKDNELAGLLLRDTRGEEANWVSFFVGHSGGRQVNYITNTKNGKSSFVMPKTDNFYMRVTRIGEILSLYSKRGVDDPWMLRARYARPDFGRVLEVGLAVQANNASGTYMARFDYMRLKDVGHIYANKREGQIDVMGYGPDKLSVSVNALRRSTIVYLQNYDKDWRAYVNGNEAPILRVNYNFQAVMVPGGSSVVEFRYVSPYTYLFALHLGASVITVLLMAVYLTKTTEVMK
ncbi:MAG: DUF1349 domain-containing protein [Deltaproteobacteria bacterium]|nr:DUF1349 domain-containing protein [Deltaproteobacteria bacterium]